MVLDSDRQRADAVCDLVRGHGYAARPLESWEQMGPPGQEMEVLLVDLDTVPTDDTRLRELSRQGARRVVMTMSAVFHHPNLGESMQRFVFAALAKPLDPDEVGFWLRSINSMKDPGPIGTDR